MEHYLRQWQRDAASKCQYDTAIFVADKLLALTNSPRDALTLAHLHFSAGSYARAHSLLARHSLLVPTDDNEPAQPQSIYLAAHCLVKQAHSDDALSLLGQRTPRHLICSTSHTRSKLALGDVHSRKESASPAARRKKKKDGENVESRSLGTHETNDKQESEEERECRRFEAGMAYLRGVCHAKQNAFERAKECYVDAVRIDVQCFEAFDQLMRNALMSPREEADFLESLDFDSVHVPLSDPLQSSTSTTAITATNDKTAAKSTAQQAASLTRMLYTTRLSKHTHQSAFTHALETLSTHYNLSHNPDLLLSKAESLFTSCRFRDALALTTAIFEDSPQHFSALPVHLACLHELNERNALQLLAHDLTDHHPDEPATWLAVGVYYLTVGRVAEARRFFSKSSMMDPHFGPAWIGFAHTFAMEGEHEQAISAYSTAARLFQGTHLPQLFLGMQSLQNNNLIMAREFLTLARELCDSDPLLLNETGCVYYQENEVDKAIESFIAALKLALELRAEVTSVLAIRTNLAHALRRACRYSEALDMFTEVLRIGGRDSAVFSAKGLVLMELEQPLEAVATLHEALSVNSSDPVATELLSRALEECSLTDTLGREKWDAGERGFASNLYARGQGPTGPGDPNDWLHPPPGSSEVAELDEAVEEILEGRIMIQALKRQRAEREARGEVLDGRSSTFDGDALGEGVERRSNNTVFVGKGKGRAGPGGSGAMVRDQSGLRGRGGNMIYVQNAAEAGRDTISRSAWLNEGSAGGFAGGGAGGGGGDVGDDHDVENNTEEDESEEL